MYSPDSQNSKWDALTVLTLDEIKWKKLQFTLNKTRLNGKCFILMLINPFLIGTNPLLPPHSSVDQGFLPFLPQW